MYPLSVSNSSRDLQRVLTKDSNLSCCQGHSWYLTMLQVSSSCSPFDSNSTIANFEHEFLRSDGWWRDILAVTFDFNSIKGPDVPEFLQKFGVPDIEKLVSFFFD